MKTLLRVSSGIAIVAVVLTLVFDVSCVPIYRKKVIHPSDYPLMIRTIVALQTTSGEKIVFKKKWPALLLKDMILVSGPESRGVFHLPLETVKANYAVAIPGERRFKNIVETTDGGYYRGAIRQTADSIHLNGGRYLRTIPLNEVELVWIRKVNVGATVIAGAGLLVAMAALAVAISFAISPPEPTSCPMIYSFNGKEYVLDAEPYGAAICRGLERVEWVGLDNIEPVRGRYKLLMSNELDETDRTDELKLVVVDHAPGITVVPDVMGRMMTFAAPSPPIAAVDSRSGRDILPLVAAKDERFWVSRMEGRDPGLDRDLKDELVFEFAKPDGARKAKLVANVWNTAWGVGAVKLLLEGRGRTLPAWLNEIGARGPAYRSILNWFVREEMFNLQVRVETPGGWKSRALLVGSGAVIAKDKAYTLDLGDVPGDLVRIKLTPASAFWMVDYLALDFSEDVPVKVTEVAPFSAVDRSGRDVRAELAEADGTYQVLGAKGDTAKIEFTAPPKDRALARTVFVKARGYYDIPLETNAEPNMEVVSAFDKPGESLRYLLLHHPVIAAGNAEGRSGKDAPGTGTTAAATDTAGTAKRR